MCVDGGCRDSCEQWCERNPDDRVARGGLYFEFRGLTHSHSVVWQPDGTLMDITPMEPLRQDAHHLFQESRLRGDECADVAAKLYTFLDRLHRQP
ncbi:hypothetical protein GCM10011400_22680 [Paraburkholderia caffeinilytica]|uniref:Uncharacterized protein n=1 Tax=Paraburkholderia caffeinilytica TaxID=1761016 RepID=A0ABQ1M6F4_9BURK|nr:hypothetical protein GCM10011400_22680 [Paraburkholderia caffeinilytica]